jgi:hypothetical protein
MNLPINLFVIMSGVVAINLAMSEAMSLPVIDSLTLH